MTQKVAPLTNKILLVFIACLLSISLIFAQDHQKDAHEQEPAKEEVTHDQHQAHDEEHHGDAGGHEEEEFNAGAEIMHHVLDTHDWHLTDWPTSEGLKPIAIHFPWLFYSKKDGIQYVAHTEDLVGKGYVAIHDHLYPLKDGVHPHLDEHGSVHFNSPEEETAWIEENVDKSNFVFDFSLTKTVVQMLLICIILVLVFTAVARGYKKNDGKAPKGLQSLMEPIIVFVRDDIAKEYMGKSYARFVPYLLTLFFFIWFSNLFGLMPFNSNITGNISVTAALAILTFIITQVNGTRDYWQHIFNMPGVPTVLKTAIPLVPLVEFIGLFTKPFSLAIRLFANITAGHFMVLGLISLIFIVGKNGASPSGAYAIMPLSVLFTLIIFCLEMIVAIIQAYVFTLLTAVFVGMALETHDDHH